MGAVSRRAKGATLFEAHGRRAGNAHRHRWSAGLRQSRARGVHCTRGRDRRRFRSTRTAGGETGPARRGRSGAQPDRPSFRQIFEHGGPPGAHRPQGGPRCDGLCSALRPARVLRDPKARHDPIPSLAVAASSRSLLDPVGDHPRADRNRAVDLSPDLRARRRTRHPAKAGRDRSRRHGRLALLRQDFPARGLGPGRGRRSRCLGPGDGKHSGRRSRDL